MADRQFPPPRVVRILSIVQILFFHQPSNRHMVCKVDVQFLNKKLQKLQNEGMKILGILFTDLDKEDPFPYQLTPPVTTPTEGGA